MKPRQNPFGLLPFAVGLVFGWAPLSLAYGADAPPPPPFVNSDAPAAPSAPSVSGMPDSPAGMPDSPAGASAAPTATPLPSFNPSDQANSSIAAPEISDDQQIHNAMDMAMDMYHAEDYDACVKATGAILDKYPKKQLFWVLYLNALALEQQDLYLPALDRYQKVKLMAPHTTYSNAAAFRIGLCQLKSGQAEEAIYTLRDIIENNPHSEYRLQAYLHLGNLYRTSREWKAAQRIYKDLIHFYPNTSWAWTSTLYLAETHAHQGDINGALHVYLGMLRDPAMPVIMRAQAQLRMGDLEIADQRWLEALQTYREALRDFSNVPGVAATCDEKIKIATEGRRWGKVPYRQVNKGIHVTAAPEDEKYQLGQEQEKVPYQP